MNHVLAGLVAFAVTAAGGAVVLAAAGPGSGGPDAAVRLQAEPPPAPLSEREVSAGIDAPVWRPGYSWVAEFGSTGWECRIVVVAADAEGYTQGLSCDGADREAARIAAFPQAYLGRLDRDLAAGTSSGIRWFDWPLTDGKEWEAEWGVETLEITARFEPAVPGPYGEEPGYVITAEYEGGSDPVLAWNYVPSIGWWSQLEFVSSGYTLTVVGFDPAWRGTAFTGEATQRLDLQPLPGARTRFVPQASFAMDEDEDLLVFYGTGSGIYSERAQLVAPSGDVLYDQSHQALGAGSSTSLWAFLDGEPGTWQLRLEGASFGALRYRAFGVDLQEWQV